MLCLFVEHRVHPASGRGVMAICLTVHVLWLHVFKYYDSSSRGVLRSLAIAIHGDLFIVFLDTSCSNQSIIWQFQTICEKIYVCLFRHDRFCGRTAYSLSYQNRTWFPKFWLWSLAFQSLWWLSWKISFLLNFQSACILRSMPLNPLCKVK